MDCPCVSVCRVVIVHSSCETFDYVYGLVFFFFKQKTAYEMRISDWSSDVCSSDLCLSFMSAVLDNRHSLLPGRFEFLMGLYAENYHRLTRLFAPQQLAPGRYVSNVDDGLDEIGRAHV